MSNSGAKARPVLREASVADLAAMRLIYAHHVLHGTASFEIVPPSLEEFERRFQSVRDSGLPWVVAELEGRLLGYAYATSYRPRAAYRFTVEDSVYVEKSAQRRGVGRALLSAVIEGATRAGKRQMVAVVGDSGNHGSVALHERLGFRRVGTFAALGFKFGRWLDCVLLQRSLGEGSTSLPEEGSITPRF